VKTINQKTNVKPVYKEDQVFLDELERLKRQEQDANDAAEALRKEFAKDTEDLLLQVGTAKASSTNTVNTASSLVSIASPYGELSFIDTGMKRIFKKRTKTKLKTDKTEHGMEKCEKTKSNQSQKVNRKVKVKVNPDKVKDNSEKLNQKIQT
ncbi:hypothetical protein Tco_0061276, partial [Tanacetum coccineum]